MRRVVAVALLAVAAPALAADAPPVVSLKVGEERPLGGGIAPICDDPRVAVITADGGAVLKAIGPGETLCSVAHAYNPGIRSVYRVVVTADAPKDR